MGKRGGRRVRWLGSGIVVVGVWVKGCGVEQGKGFGRGDWEGDIYVQKRRGTTHASVSCIALPVSSAFTASSLRDRTSGRMTCHLSVSV